MWAEFFIFGGVWFWLLVAAEIIGLFIAVGNDSPAGAFIVFIVFVALAHLFGDATWLSTVKTNPLESLVGVFAYFVIGVFWSFIKLRIWAKKQKKNKMYSKAPTFYQIKGHVVTWVTWWPISFMSTFLYDIIVDFCDWLVDRFKGVYEAILRSIWDEAPVENND